MWRRIRDSHAVATQPGSALTGAMRSGCAGSHRAPQSRIAPSRDSSREPFVLLPNGRSMLDSVGLDQLYFSLLDCLQHCSDGVDQESVPQVRRVLLGIIAV